MGFVSSDKARRYLRSLPAWQRAPFKDLWPQLDPVVRRGRASGLRMVCSTCPEGIAVLSLCRGCWRARWYRVCAIDTTWKAKASTESCTIVYLALGSVSEPQTDQSSLASLIETCY